MKAIICDVDDTICASTKPASKEMTQQINRLLESNIIMAFISGSTIDQILDQLSCVYGYIHILGCSGAEYIQYESDYFWHTVHKKELSEHEADEIIQVFHWLIDKYNIQPLTNVSDQLQNRKQQVTLSCLGRHAPQEEKRRFDPTGELRKFFVKEILAQFPMLTTTYDIRIGGTTSIDIGMNGIDKAYGTRQFLQHNNLKPSEVLFIGDKLELGGNDYAATQVCNCLQVKDELETLEFFKKIIPQGTK